MDFYETEEAQVKSMFNLEEIIEFNRKHRIEVILLEDLQYSVRIDGNFYSSGLTFLSALIYGINSYKDNYEVENDNI